MIEGKLEWSDIDYFSKGTISSNRNGTLTITVNKELSPVEFVEEFLAAASTAQVTLNSVQTLDNRSENFPLPSETQPVLDEQTDTYSKTIAYTFALVKTFSREEIEGN